jgi:2,3-bisphosphoglycerate-dependent phosphoglycerate mutase
MADPSVSKWPTLLAVMRHAESLATERRRHLEESRSQEIHLGLPMRDVDVPLTSEGREHARSTGSGLNDLGPFDVVYVSPYRRTVETAEEVLTALRSRPPLVKEERLREKEWGILEGLTRHGISTRHPDEEARRRHVGKYYYRPPGGESYADVNLRVHSFIGTLVREHAGQRVLVITHQVVVVAFRKLLERMEEDTVLALDRQDEARPASLLIYELRHPDGGTTALVRTHWNLILFDRTLTRGAHER